MGITVPAIKKSFSLTSLSLTSLILLSTPSVVLAHGSAAELDVGKFQVGVAASLSYYSKGTVDKNEYWRIPGLMMGGEATPTVKGFAIDDAVLWGNYKLNDHIRAYGKLGVHGGSESHGSVIELENLYLKYKPFDEKTLSISAGVMGAEFSPLANHHASQSTFSEASLLADAFLGRGGHDGGLRLRWNPTVDLTLGAEIWDGGTFPGTSSEGTQDIYLKYNTFVKDWMLHTGVWALKAKADQRGDERYSDGHNHGTEFSPLPADIRFSGNTEMAGAWFALKSPQYRGARIVLQYEALKSESKGEIFDTTRKADYKNDNLGYSLETSLNYSEYQLSYRYEKLSLENQIDGTAAEFLAANANLNTDKNPNRQTLQLKWQANKNIALRAAYTKDNSLAEESERYSVGLVWRDVLLQK